MIFLVTETSCPKSKRLEHCGMENFEIMVNNWLPHWPDLKFCHGFGANSVSVNRGFPRQAVFALMILLCLQGTVYAAGQRVLRETDGDVVFADSSGRETTLKKNPKRVVICYLSVVGVWLLSGGEVIGIPDVREPGSVPDFVKGAVSVGAFGNPNMERILSLKPDLVILAGRLERHRAAAGLFSQSKTDNILLDYNNYDDFLTLLDLFYRLNGGAENKRAEAVKKEAGDITAKFSGRKGPRFLAVLATGGHINAECSLANTARMAEMLGGVNIVKIAPDPGKLTVKLSAERILAEDPDIILVTTAGDSPGHESAARALFSGEPWRNLRAVKEGKLYFLPGALFRFKANERYPEAFKMLAQILWPEEKLN
jgi:iron complex transport system substrate-binding protein